MRDGSGSTANYPGTSRQTLLRTRSNLDSSEATPLRRGASIAGGIAVAVLLLLYGYPLARVLQKGFRWSIVTRVATDHRNWSVAWFTVWQATASTVGVLLLAIPLAALVAGQQRAARRGIFLAAVATPFTLPTVVVAASLREVLPQRFSSGVVAILCAHIFYNVGMATLMIVPRFEQIDQNLSDAAATLGASSYRAARTITLRLVGPAIRNAAVLTFTLCFTSFGVVLMLGGARRSTIDVEIYRQALQRLRLDRASVLAMAQFVVLATLAYAASRTSLPTSSNRAARRSRRPMSRWVVLARAAVFASIITVMLAPIAALLRRSFREPNGSFGTANYRALARITPGSGLLATPISSFAVSARSAIFASALALALGTALAVAAREMGKRTGAGFRLLAALPLATSSVQLGLGFLLAFATSPLAWRSRWFAVPLVQAVVAVPFVVRQIGPVLDAISPDLRGAAMTLGARPWQAWRTVDLRLSRHALGAALSIAIAISLGEFGAATFLARPGGPTVPIAIARLSGLPGAIVQGQAAALASLLGVLTLVIVLLGRISWERNRHGGDQNGGQPDRGNRVVSTDPAGPVGATRVVGPKP